MILLMVFNCIMKQKREYHVNSLLYLGIWGNKREWKNNQSLTYHPNKTPTARDLRA